MKKTADFKKPVITAGIIFGLAIIAAVLFSLFYDDSPKPSGLSAEKPAREEKASEDKTPKADNVLLCMITSVSDDLSTLSVKILNDGTVQDFKVTNGTTVRSVYGKAASITNLKTGDFIKLSAYPDGTVATADYTDEVKTYKNVINLVIDDSLKKITVGNTVYRYDDRLSILDENGKPLSSDVLSALDVFDVSSLDGVMYLIRVVKGHGYITFKNTEYFEDSMIRIDDDETEILNSDTILPLSTGTYTVTVEKNDVKAEAVLSVSSGSTVTMDLAPFTPKPEEKGAVAFSIDPYGASLYIGGQKMNYGDPVTLPYGSYDVEANADGYVSFTGTLKVDRPNVSFAVTLSPKPTPTPEPTPEPTPVPTPEPTSEPTPVPDETAGTGDADGTAAASETDD